MLAHHSKRLLLIGILLMSLLPILPSQLDTAHAQCPANKWTGSFFNSTDLSGAVAASVCNDLIDFNWGLGAPVNGVGIDNFSARWTSTQILAAPGSYIFTVTVEDGARLNVNGVTIIDSMIDVAGVRVLTGVYTTNAVNTPAALIFDFVNVVGNAQVTLTWALAGSVPPTSGGGESWFVEYFNNLTWSGSPVATEFAAADGINRNYGRDIPKTGVVADGWSARWTRGVTFPAGTYTFTLRADDGAKLRIDGNEVLNQAQFANGANFNATVALSQGRHILTVEHHDVIDIGYLFLTWSPAVGTSIAPNAPTAGVTTPPAAPPSGGAVATVNTAGLFFRSAPSTSATILRTIRQGEQYTAIGRSADSVWVQLQIQGTNGWSMAQFLVLNTAISNLPVTDGTVVTPPPPTTATGVLAKSRGFMKIRSGPGTTYSRIGGIGPGTVVTLLGRSPDGAWYLLDVNGLQGWSAASYYEIFQGSLSSVPVIQG